MAASIKRQVELKTDTFVTHELHFEVEAHDLPQMSNLDICYLTVVLHSPQGHRPVVKKIRLNVRDMSNLTDMFVIRDF